MEAMIEDLQSFDVEKIEKAFKRWRQESEKVPTPAAIIKLIHASLPRASQPERESRNPKYHELTDAGKRLVDDAFAEAKENLRTGKSIPRPAGAVPWYGKTWSHFTTDDKKNLFQHYNELAGEQGVEHATGYMKYLKLYCGVPANFWPDSRILEVEKS